MQRVEGVQEGKGMQHGEGVAPELKTLSLSLTLTLRGVAPELKTLTLALTLAFTRRGCISSTRVEDPKGVKAGVADEV